MPRIKRTTALHYGRQIDYTVLLFATIGVGTVVIGIARFVLERLG